MNALVGIQIEKVTLEVSGGVLRKGDNIKNYHSFPFERGG